MNIDVQKLSLLPVGEHLLIEPINLSSRSDNAINTSTLVSGHIRQIGAAILLNQKMSVPKAARLVAGDLVLFDRADCKTIYLQNKHLCLLKESNVLAKLTQKPFGSAFAKFKYNLSK